MNRAQLQLAESRSRRDGSCGDTAGCIPFVDEVGVHPDRRLHIMRDRMGATDDHNPFQSPREQAAERYVGQEAFFGFMFGGRQISLPVVAALLTIMGYSLNDTIVVFDRIREDLTLHKGRSYTDIINLSINQTLSRTLLTSFTTLLVALTLYLFGGGAINDFALVMLIGVVVGTYSSVFVASTIISFWHRRTRGHADA